MFILLLHGLACLLLLVCAGWGIVHVNSRVAMRRLGFAFHRGRGVVDVEGHRFEAVRGAKGWRLSAPPRRHVPLSLSRDFGLPDTPIGDRRFDASIQVVDHRPPHGLSFLGPRARRAATAAVDLGARFEDGAWSMPLPAIEAIPRALAVLAEATSAFDDDGLSTVQRLQRLVLSDRRHEVRLEALAQLQRLGPVDEAIWQPLLHGHSVRLRFIAAQHLHAVPTMVALLTDGSRSWRVRAAEWLADHAPDHAPVEVEEVLITALDDPEHQERAARVLALVGTSRAATALFPRTDRPSRAAWSIIRRRLGPDLSGAVSLASCTGGDLSLA